MAETVLETIGLTKRFDGILATDNVNFQLRMGELRCLIGPNGAGKSTFFKCITGLHSPTDGQVYMRGQEVSGWNPHRIASLGVGIKTQIPSLMDGLSVFENIWMAAHRFNPGKSADKRAREIVDKMALGAIIRAKTGQLAHGERQRVELGIVAAGDPWLILLDEPAAGLSADEMNAISAIIRDMTARAAVILVEHDMQFIRAIAETVTVFHHGRVLMEGSAGAVMSDPTVRRVYLGKKA